MKAGILSLAALGCLSLAACTVGTNGGDEAASGTASAATEIFNLAVTGMT